MRFLILALLGGCLYVDVHEAPHLEGAHRVVELPVGESFEGDAAVIGDRLAFATTSLDVGGAVYITDGTSLEQLGRYAAVPHGLAVVDGALVFVAADATSGGVWRSDGTAAGTRLLAPLPISDAAVGTALRGRYYVAERGLWSTDGATIEHAYDGLVMPPADTANGVVFFSQEPGGLHKTDGTAAGTTLVTSAIAPTCRPLAPTSRYQFFACDTRLWRTDATAAGTIQILDTPGLDLRIVGEALGRWFFTAQNLDGVADLWGTSGEPDDATLVGTMNVDAVVELHGRPIVAGGDGLWTITTSRLSRFYGFDSRDPIVLDDLVVFGCKGSELCRTDGTIEGMYETKDSGIITASNFYATEELLYFRSYSGPACGNKGCAELWAIPRANLRDP